MDLFGIILSLILVIGVIGVIFNILVWLYKHIILLYNYFANKEQSNNSPNTQKKIIDLFEVRRNELINSPEFRKNIEQASNFEKEIEILKQGYIRYSSKEAILNNYNLLFKEISSAQYQKYKITEFKSFYHTYSNLNSLVASWNQGYVKSEISRCSWLDNIDGKTLDPQQRRAVVVNEDNNLVLAGAGSGKTLTISAKVKYLVEEKKVDPADILLITFTRKAAAEMQDRISNKLKIHVEASTFHKFGLDIYKKVLGSRPDVFDDLESVVDTYFKKDIFLHKKAVKNVIEFFGLYINVPTNYDKINCLGQVIEREKNLDLETIKSKVETEIQESTKNRKTINGEHVKSIEEVIIANHLYLNGINYEYEYLYPFETEDKFRKRYRPDFYLPDYDLYLEHFGIDKNGRVPWLSKIEEQKYLDDMAWKRALHKKNGTTLIETYSYFNKYGHLLIELDKILKKNGVTYNKVDYREIFKRMVIDKDDRTYSAFRKLVITFINLFKSNGYDEESFSLLEGSSDSQLNIFFKYREKMFLSIIKPLFVKYQQTLREKGCIDFNDMINLSTASIQEGKLEIGYKYIIVDEYQDISVSRFRLIKAIKDRTNAIVMAVGDDWQSIYRFAGSDIDLFTNFSSYFGHTEVLKIENTYRNAQELIDIAGKFVLKNPKQFTKKLVSDKRIINPIRVMIYKNDVYEAFYIALKGIVRAFGTNLKVLVLGRNNYDIDALQNRKDLTVLNEGDKIKITSQRYPSLIIEFLTIHKAKGLEADNVIVINMENKLSGFPNKIVDDPILSLVLSNSEKYEYAEERRLLYVAMTRTKNITYLLAPDETKSCFINELIRDNHQIPVQKATTEDIMSMNPNCPRCKNGTLVLREDSEGRKFMGCSNYPLCDNTYNDIEILRHLIICDLCDGYMVKRKGKNGEFYGCSNYPICNNTIDNINVNTSCNFNTEGDKERLSERRIQRIKQYPPNKRFP